MPYRKVIRQLAVLAPLLTMVACGGSGGGGVSPPPPPPPPPPSSWQQGVFMPASTYQAQCQAPRNGTNPATGQAYPDIQGSTLDENNFLRSYSNDTYLWYDEIVDRDPGLYSDTLVYFDLLKTTATTASGKDKDPDGFHFAIDSEEFRLEQAGISYGYGFEFIFLSTVPPREVAVVYTEPNTSATSPQVNLARGARFTAIDGVDINANSQADVDVLNAGLFPTLDGETHTFTVRDLGSQVDRDVTMTATTIEETLVQNVHVEDTPTGAVGYMLFNSHRGPAEELWVDAVNLFNAHNGGQGIDDLVLDLRYNRGGNLFLAAQIGYMLAGTLSNDGTNNRIFETSQFNDKYPSTNPVTGQAILPTPFFNETIGWQNLAEGLPLPTLNLPRVFVLTGRNTCSASEAIINGLRGIDIEVIQIGSITCGKPYGFYGTDNCGNTYFTIQLKGVNEKGFGEYADGFKAASSNEPFGVSLPGCSVPDDYDHLLGDPQEARFKAALDYRDFQTCPAPPPSGISQLGISKAAPEADNNEGVVPKSFYDSNRMYDLPVRQ